MATKQIKSSRASWQTASSTVPVTHEKSSLFVKKLVAMTISHVLYLRGLFPEEAFRDREMYGVRVKIICDKSKIAPVVQVIEWLKAAFDAFDRKYLEKLEFIFFGSEKPVILESYSFMFTYSNGEVSVTCGTASNNVETKRFKLDEVRLATVQLLRHSSLLLENMRNVSENLLLKVRLYYYVDVTPDNYEPPGFERAPDSEYTFEPSNIKLRHGVVDTGFHSMKLSSRIGLSRFLEPDELSEDIRPIFVERQKKRASNKKSQKEPMDSNPSSQPPQESVSKQQDSQNDVAMDLSMQKRRNCSQESSYTFVGDTPTDVQNANVYCACGVPVDEGVLIFCEICRRWNHAICYRVTDEKAPPSNFCCIFCHNSTPDANCNDKSLISLSEDHRKSLCLYRRALAFSLSSWRVNQKILASELSVSSEMAFNILAWLKADSVFTTNRRRGKGLYHQINMYYLKEIVIPEYFQKAKVKLPTVSNSSLQETSNANDENENPVKGKKAKVDKSVSFKRRVVHKRVK